MGGQLRAVPMHTGSLSVSCDKPNPGSGSAEEAGPCQSIIPAYDSSQAGGLPGSQSACACTNRETDLPSLAPTACCKLALAVAVPKAAEEQHAVHPSIAWTSSRWLQHSLLLSLWCVRLAYSVISQRITQAARGLGTFPNFIVSREKMPR